MTIRGFMIGNFVVPNICTNKLHEVLCYLIEGRYILWYFLPCVNSVWKQNETEVHQQLLCALQKDYLESKKSRMYYFKEEIVLGEGKFGRASL